MGLQLLLHVEKTRERERETNESMWGKRIDEREKINKIVIYTSAVTVQICTVTIANVYICMTIVRLIRSRFREYCINFASFSILHNFAPIDLSALRGIVFQKGMLK